MIHYINDILARSCFSRKTHNCQSLNGKTHKNAGACYIYKVWRGPLIWGMLGLSLSKDRNMWPRYSCQSLLHQYLFIISNLGLHGDGASSLQTNRWRRKVIGSGSQMSQYNILILTKNGPMLHYSTT